jgi:cytochrome P450/glutathione S-transferase
MEIVNNELDAIRFKKDFSYSKAVPTLVSNNVGTLDEIARWVLDRNSILYKDESHGLWKIQSKANAITGEGIKKNYPVMQMTDALIYSVDGILMFWEQRCLPQNRLIPGDIAQQDDAMDLYHLFTGKFFECQVSKYMYSSLLISNKDAAKVFKQRIPFLERLKCSLLFGAVKKSVISNYNLNANNPEEYIVQIRKIFSHVNSMLSDGRKYLVGGKFTVADVAFAAIAAPMILPVEFGGVLPQISQLPEAYRNHVTELRATPAGQFVFRMYQAHRPTMIPQTEIPKEPGFIKKALGRFIIKLKKRQSNLFYKLQKKWPVLKLPIIKLVLVNRNDLLVEMMNRDKDFTVEEINSKKMSDQKGAFFLGMDTANPQFNRERDFVRKATKKDDMELIRAFVRQASADIISKADNYGKIDVADSFCKVVLVRLIDFYFGVAAPTERCMKTWHRALFYDLFLNFTNNKVKHDAALKAADERKECLLQIIAARKQELAAGKQIADNIFNRLIIMSQEPGYEWVDDDCLQRNIGGLLTGIFETTNKSVVLVLDELFNRPEALAKAIEVAKEGDMKKMYGIVSEALRFNPAQPGVIRFNETKQVLNGYGNKSYTIPAKRKVFAITSAAMFDPAAFPEPLKFIGDRNAIYMNYGYALHECYGKYINAVTISEFVAAVLQLKNVRRATGIVGRGTGITQQSFPNNFVVCFDTAKEMIFED